MRHLPEKRFGEKTALWLAGRHRVAGNGSDLGSGWSVVDDLPHFVHYIREYFTAGTVSRLETFWGD
jgi:hypothetical protein